ncbi:MAG: right-handed parallel beta-helix repeat-containing protein [Myxococcales bacterium]|nr:right-handed parallel beta-helix repeat-containing protein [Myxococcales bacterium]
MMLYWMPVLVGGCGGGPVWYADLDGDGFGDDATARRASVAPPGHTGQGGDCDDADAAVHPGAPEVCNDGVDDDCDGLADDADADVDPMGMQPWYVDADGDRYGDPLVSLEACAALEGYVAAGLDCDDTDPTFRTGVFWVDASGAETEVTEAFQSGSLAGVHRFEAPGNGRLELCPGTYYATVSGADELHVVGRIPGTVVLDGAYETRPESVPSVTAVAGGQLTVEHVTLRNGWQAIAAQGLTTTLRDVTVTEYVAPERGSVISSEYGSLDVEGLVAHDNPGVVLGVSWSDADIRDSVFTGNGQDAAFVVSVRSDSATLRDVRLHDNHASGSTLALSSRVQVDRAEVTDNRDAGCGCGTATAWS